MKRGDVWLTQIGPKRRPVLVLTRDSVLDVRELVTVAEITTSGRGLAVEVSLDDMDLGLDPTSVVNCDGLYTIPRSSLTDLVGAADPAVMRDVCWAIGYGLGC